MIVGCYTLDLYCDNPQCVHTGESEYWPTQICDEFGSSCRRRARKRGWKLNSDHTLCPDCAAEAAKEAGK